MKRNFDLIMSELAVLEEREEYHKMVPLYEEALESCMELYGPRSVEVLQLRNRYGGMLRNLSMYERGEAVLREALDIARELRGADHPDYATTMLNLANLIRAAGKLDEAEPMFLETLAIYQMTIGGGHFMNSGVWNNLGLLYQEKGELEKAENCFLRGMDILKGREEYLVPYAIALHNTVDLYKMMGRREQAEANLKEELRIYEGLHYETSVLYAAALNSLAVLYFEDGQLEKAREVAARSVEITLYQMGEHSDCYISSKENLEMIENAIAKKTAMAHAAPAGKESSMIKGMDLCRGYFEDICRPMLEAEFKEYLPRMAAGMIGDGSECLGFDDEISRDHDFGPAVQIYIPKEDMPVYGERLMQRLETLPKEYKGFVREESFYGGGRVGVFTIDQFYRRFLSIGGVPKNYDVWRAIPESHFATATNGEVFFDNYGEFTRIREELLKGYPEDVRLKKIAARLMTMAQSGQYNFGRCAARQEFVAASLALSEFVEATMSLVYLLNRKYCPYYKWSHRGLSALPALGRGVQQKLARLVTLSPEKNAEEIVWLVEDICVLVVDELRAQQLSFSPEPFLLAQGPMVLSRIQDPELRESNPWVE